MITSRDLAPRKKRVGFGKKHLQSQEFGQSYFYSYWSKCNAGTHFGKSRGARNRSRFKSINAHDEQEWIELRWTGDKKNSEDPLAELPYWLQDIKESVRFQVSVSNWLLCRTFGPKLVFVKRSFVRSRLVELVLGHPRPSRARAPVYRGGPCTSKVMWLQSANPLRVGWSRAVAWRSCSWSWETGSCASVPLVPSKMSSKISEGCGCSHCNSWLTYFAMYLVQVNSLMFVSL